MINQVKRFFGVHIHDWGKWEQSGKYTFRDGSGRITNERIRLQRSCSTCGILSFTSVGT